MSIMVQLQHACAVQQRLPLTLPAVILPSFSAESIMLYPILHPTSQQACRASLSAAAVKHALSADTTSSCCTAAAVGWWICDSITCTGDV